MSILLNGFVLGWSVAWPPGPVNAEMIRRGLLPREQGGGFWATWRVGLGAGTGDCLWALGVAVRSGARIFARPGWQVWTQALTAAVMVYFAAKLAFQLFR